MSPVRIGVVGGGLAGIAAALAAADGGAEVVLVERRPALGGLTTSIRRNGLSFDNGQHVFLRCCTAYRDFIERIGAAEQVFVQARLDLPVLAPDGSRASIRRTALPAPLHLLGSLARYRHLSVRERVQLARPALALRRLEPEDALLDDVSFGDWLAGKGQSSRAVEHLWNLIALPTLNVPASRAPLGLATKVFRVGLLDRADAGDIGWSRVPLAELHGQNAARALAAAGVETVLGSPVSSIDRSPGGSFTVTSAGRRMVVDAVVVATPPRVSAALGAFGDPDAAERLGTSPIVNVHLVLDRQVIDLPLVACVNSPIQFIFDRTASSGATSGQCLAISLSAADEYIAADRPSSWTPSPRRSASCCRLRATPGWSTRSSRGSGRRPSAQPRAPGRCALRPGRRCPAFFSPAPGAPRGGLRRWKARFEAVTTPPRRRWPSSRAPARATPGSWRGRARDRSLFSGEARRGGHRR